MWDDAESDVRLEQASIGELVRLACQVLEVLAARPTTDLEPGAALDLAASLGAGLDLGEAALSGLLGIADRAGEASARRYPGTRGFLKTELGMRGGRANERLTVSRQLPRLPRVAEALAAGKLPYGYASVICEAVVHLSDEECATAEEILLGMTDEGLSVAKVAKAGARIAELIAERDGREREPEDGRRSDRQYWQISKSLGGHGYSRGRFRPELMALLQDRLGPLAKPVGPDDLRDVSERMADALEMYLAGGGSNWNATLVIKLTETDLYDPTTSTPTSSTAPRPDTDAPPAAGSSRAACPRPSSDPGQSPSTVSNAAYGETPSSNPSSPPRPDTSPTPTLSATSVPASSTAANHGTHRGPVARQASSLHPAASPSPSASPDNVPSPSVAAPPGTSPEPGASRAATPDHIPDPNTDTDPLLDLQSQAVPETETGAETMPGTGSEAGIEVGPKPTLEVGRRFPVWPLEDVGPGWRITARLSDGTPVRPEVARRIALNAGISALLLGPGSVPLYLGRKTRLVTAGQRQALEALYETCACDECDVSARHCQLDHVWNWSDGGLTNIDLLAPACAFHNRLKYAHPEWFTVTHENGRWRYSITRTYGRRRHTTYSGHKVRAPHSGDKARAP